MNLPGQSTSWSRGGFAAFEANLMLCLLWMLFVNSFWQLEEETAQRWRYVSDIFHLVSSFSNNLIYLGDVAPQRSRIVQKNNHLAGVFPTKICLDEPLRNERRVRPLTCWIVSLFRECVWKQTVLAFSPWWCHKANNTSPTLDSEAEFWK